MKKPGAILLAAPVLLLTLLAWPALAQADTTEIVSVSSDGVQGDSYSFNPSLSGDGSVVAFTSDAHNLVSGDTKHVWDVFVRDLDTGTTARVSVASDGTEGNGDCLFPSISADGKVVAFQSWADNLVDEDTNDWCDVFVHYMESGVTTRVSVSSDGTQANGDSSSPSINADGSVVAFHSYATNLVDGDSNGYADVFVHSLLTGTTRVSVSSDGAQGDADSIRPSISADGSVVAFESDATNLVDGDKNNRTDVFVRRLGTDPATGTTSLVSVSGGGTQGNGGSTYPSISADGKVVAFQSWADNLADVDVSGGARNVFVHDLGSGATELVSVSSDGTQGNNDSGSPSISADGKVVAFESEATNLVDVDANGTTFDVFARNLESGTTELVSVATNGTQGNALSGEPSISSDGKMVAFTSGATNLVDGDTNGSLDVFVRMPIPQQAYGHGPTRYEQDHERILYAGEWSTEEDESHSGGSIYVTNDPEASITITFRGTRLDWIAAMGPLMGKVWVSIDGGEPVLVDLFSDTELFQQMVWSTGTLAYGVHTIKIYYPEDLDTSEIKPINIDAVDVWGVLLETTES